MDKGEVLRYLGGASSNPVLDAMIQRAQREIEKASHPRSVWKRFSLSVEEKGVVLGGQFLPSRDLSDHLRGCREAFLFAFTLGPEVDALIKRYQLVEVPLVPVLQACAAAYTEEQADAAQEPMEAWARERGLYLRPRYSPGYGDFSLENQRFIFQALEVPKRTGITLTENCLMLPLKSITAVVGVSLDPSLCHVGKCMTCLAAECPFRKGGASEKKEENVREWADG